MIRLLAVPLLAAVLVSGCSETFRPDVVARVDDTELTRDELDGVLGALTPDSADNADVVRSAIGLFVQVEAVRAELARNGVEVTDEDRDTANSSLANGGIQGFTELDDELRDLLVEWQAVFILGEQFDADQRFAAVDAADVWIKPRFGTLHTTGEVIPLGLPTAQP